MVAALSVQEVLLEVPVQKCQDEIKVDNSKQTLMQSSQTRIKWAGFGNLLLLEDAMVLLRPVGAADFENRWGQLIQFCTDNELRHKTVAENRKLRLQLTVKRQTTR
jgi:hypothetical protein